MAMVLMLALGCDPNTQTDQQPKSTRLILGNEMELQPQDPKSMYWVRQDANGKVRYTTFAKSERRALKDFAQVAKISPMTLGDYAVLSGQKMVISGDKDRFEVDPLRGFLVWYDGSVLQFGELLQEDCLPVGVELSTDAIVRDGHPMGKAYYLESEKTGQDEDGNWLVEKHVGNILTVGNDTGTVVVILDNFRLQNPPCCETAWADCCAGKGPTRNMGVKPAAPAGYQILLMLPLSEVCMMERCQTLLVHNCTTGETWCLDSMVGRLRVDVTDAGWVMVSTLEDAAANEVMTKCP